MTDPRHFHRVQASPVDALAMTPAFALADEVPARRSTRVAIEDDTPARWLAPTPERTS